MPNLIHSSESIPPLTSPCRPEVPSVELAVDCCGGDRLSLVSPCPTAAASKLERVFLPFVIPFAVVGFHVVVTLLKLVDRRGN